MDVQGFDEKYIPQEELSPTTEEYQECCAPDDDYQYDIATVGELLAAGCVAPAPTPAPSIAPLAEVEVDPPDDDVEMVDQQSEMAIGTAMIPTTVAAIAEKQDSVEHKRKRKKKNSIEMKTDKDLESGDAIVAITTTTTTTVVTASDDPHNRNAVCPWEDE